MGLALIRIHSYGPLFWGVEEDPIDTRILTWSWLVEDLPPYRRSTHAFRIGVGNRRLHVGLCKKAPRSPHKALPQVSPSAIGQWGKRVPQEEATPNGAVDPEPVRQVQPGGTDRLHRSGDDEDGGTVPGVITL